MEKTRASIAFGFYSPYEGPRGGLRMEDCGFYHTIEIPGHGMVRGMWDLRGGMSAYLGIGLDVRIQRNFFLNIDVNYLNNKIKMYKRVPC
jgi:hypothetical protein